MEKRIEKRIFVLVGKIYPTKFQVYRVLGKLGIRGVKLVIMGSFSQIKKRFSYDNYTGDRVEAIFVGQVPHKSHGTLSGSIISEISLTQARVPVYPCKTKAGQLKATKAALETAFADHHSTTKAMDTIPS
jgi:hypothetical protein